GYTRKRNWHNNRKCCCLCNKSTDFTQRSLLVFYRVLKRCPLALVVPAHFLQLCYTLSFSSPYLFFQLSVPSRLLLLLSLPALVLKSFLLLIALSLKLLLLLITLSLSLLLPLVPLPLSFSLP